MVKKPVNTDELISVIIKGIDDVKGDDIQLLDLREIENTVCDYFIICSGSSNTQVNAITGSIQKLVSKELKDKPWHIEGQNNSEWILMDYVNTFVTSIFHISNVFFENNMSNFMAKIQK